MGIYNKTVFPVIIAIAGLVGFAYAQNTPSEEKDAEAWDTATNISECIEKLKSNQDPVYEEGNECLYYLLPKYSAKVIPELNNKNPLVRSRLAMLFGRRQIRAATPSIVALLNDENMLVRENAIGALYDMKDPQSIPALTKLIHHESFPLQYGSIRVLLRVRNSVSGEDLAEVKRVLVENLQNPKGTVREKSVKYLGELDDPTVIPLIEDLMQNDTYFYTSSRRINGKKTEKKVFPVRDAAIKAVKQLKGLRKAQ